MDRATTNEPDAAPRVTSEDFARLAEELHAAPGAEDTAQEVVEQAIEVLGADFGAITLIRGGGVLDTVAPTDPVAAKVDRLQESLDEGPCRDAAWEADTVVSTDLVADTRWPHWAPRAAELGAGAILAGALTSMDGIRLGAVNIYWSRPKEISADDIAFVGIFTSHAAVALQNAQRLEQLNTALDVRKIIGQAQGILMERHSLTGDQAFAVLRRYSQNHNIKLREVAQGLVETRRLPHATD